MTNKKSNFSQTAWDAFQYSVIPAGFLAGMASDPRTVQLLTNLMVGGGLKHELPMAVSKGIHGLHHVERVIEKELTGRLKKLVSHAHLNKHLSGSGFQNMKRPNRPRKKVDVMLEEVEPMQDVPSSSGSSYLVPIGSLLALGVPALGYGGYKLLDHILPKCCSIGDDYEFVGSGFQDIDRDRQRLQNMQNMQMPVLDKNSSSWGPILLGLTGVLGGIGAGGLYMLKSNDMLPDMSNLWSSGATPSPGMTWGGFRPTSY